jgi:hypothetical protein
MIIKIIFIYQSVAIAALARNAAINFNALRQLAALITAR